LSDRPLVAELLCVVDSSVADESYEVRFRVAVVRIAGQASRPANAAACSTTRLRRVMVAKQL
jgi:hypothetical protein